ncbi:hypothetical protein WQ54_05320 [Bacillus sp. SA1-12]|uniref:hypothetical protein n=1 Tax=Bacillus sp. SA1-12 TaxID=1455638 RepID=UPI0006261B29|nr:hypothetical protein [Bacillus sp. SA1-12]KKI93256.1 hypothetical protein WQ54_05320 [Bacillus sp. SA1-12]
MHFELRFFKKNLYLIISLCLILSGCLRSEEKIPQSKHKVSHKIFPIGQEIIKGLKKNSPNKEHPRLMATDADFKRIKNR